MNPQERTLKMRKMELIYRVIKVMMSIATSNDAPPPDKLTAQALRTLARLIEKRGGRPFTIEEIDEAAEFALHEEQMEEAVDG